jgi:hypothetical protein
VSKLSDLGICVIYRRSRDTNVAKTATAKTATQWRYFLNILQDLPLTEMTAELVAMVQQLTVKPLVVKPLAVPGRWVLVSSGALALLFWNGRLVLATGVGVAVMALIYLMQDCRLQVPKSTIRQFVNLLSQPLVLAVVGGGTAMLSTYLAASVWSAVDSPWLAAGGILQGAGTLAVLLLLVGQYLHRQTVNQQGQFSQKLADLTHADPLRRLIAVRELTRSLRDTDQNSADRRELADYFRLMLSQESKAVVREAVLDGLQALDQVQALTGASQPVMRPELRQRTAVKRRSTTKF